MRNILTLEPMTCEQKKIPLPVTTPIKGNTRTPTQILDTTIFNARHQLFLSGENQTEGNAKQQKKEYKCCLKYS